MYLEPKDHRPERAATEEVATLSELLVKFWQVLVRRRWWALISAPLVTLAAIAGILSLSNHYVSEATVAILQPQIAPRMLAPDGGPVDDPVSALSRELLSRVSLRRLIGELNLYAEDGDGTDLDDLVTRMQDDLTVVSIPVAPGERRTGALRIAFQSKDPAMAQRVVENIASLFIRENQKVRGDRAVTTNTFAAEQVKAAEQKLIDQERRMEAFKSRNLGLLPEQQSGNLQTVMDLRNRLSLATTRISTLRQQRDTALGTLNDKLAGLRASRDALAAKFAPSHPEMVKKDQEVARLDALVRSLRQGDGVPRGQALEDTSIGLLKDQLEAGAAETKNLVEEEQSLRSQIADYENRLHTAPLRDQQMAEIQRDYALLKDDYNYKKTHLRDSNLEGDIEASQAGQQFRLVDPPSLPTKPVRPKRMQLSLFAAVGGLGLGILLAFFRDNADTSLRTTKAIQARFSVPVVLGVPPLRTATETRIHQFKAFCGWVVSVGLLAAVATAELYVYRLS